mgnify:CR=1 FL=1
MSATAAVSSPVMAAKRAERAEPIQITMRVPPEWLETAEKLAAELSRPGLEVTRTEAFRAALAFGLEHMNDAKPKATARPKRARTGLSFASPPLNC